MVSRRTIEQVITGTPAERLAAAAALDAAGAEGWTVLAELARDEALAPEVRITAAMTLDARAPRAMVEGVAASLLASNDHVLRARGMITTVRRGLDSLLPQVEQHRDDPSTFWELDAEVSLSVLASAAALALKIGVPQPEFPDWNALAPPSTPTAPHTASIDAFVQRRAQILALRPEDLQLTIERYPFPVYGLLMETGIAEGTFSVVGLADSTASLYLSDGGGTVGAGAYPNVQRALVALLIEAEHHFRDAASVSVFPEPARGRVSFYFLTRDGVRRYDAVESELEHGHDPHASLYAAAHALLGEIFATEREHPPTDENES
ncbi:hypothetical protein ACNOYE_25020 [Nannocystaceae bacterium ST9]